MLGTWLWEHLFWEMLYGAAGYAELCWKHAMGLLRAGVANPSLFMTMFPGYNA